MGYSALLQTTITVWTRGAADGSGGYSYNSPVQILGRYQDGRENLIDLDGEDYVSYAIVYTTTQYKIGDFMYKGTSATANPQEVNDAYRIRDVYTTSTPNASITIYKNILGK